jgi:biopolymer transport protein ExbB
MASEAAKGGIIGFVILALGAVAMVLVVLRAVFLHRAGSSINRTMDAVAPHVRAHRVEEAIAAAKRFKGSAARVVTASLRNLDRDREHLEDIVSESILHESTHLNRFGSVITMIAAVAPLLGLLGTVTGMIQTFDVITEFGTSDPKLLSGGSATALVTTELGLIVAIPCLLLGNLLGGWAERIKDDMEKAALKVINLYQDVRMKSVGTSGKAAA